MAKAIAIQIHRSTCLSMQSDQCLYFHSIDSTIMNMTCQLLLSAQKQNSSMNGWSYLFESVQYTHTSNYRFSHKTAHTIQPLKMVQILEKLLVNYFINLISAVLPNRNIPKTCWQNGKHCWPWIDCSFKVWYGPTLLAQNHMSEYLRSLELRSAQGFAYERTGPSTGRYIP